MIVAAVGESDRSEQVVAEADALADAFDEETHVVHVLSPMEARKIEQDATESSTMEFDDEPDDGEEAAREIAAAATVGSDATPVGLVGKASEQIIGYADEHDARYIVVGKRKRSPTGKAVFGSVTQSVLLNADQPVLSVM
ncbi:universal stress protein [Halococcus qingdaonensis]|uniref:universal stress protein n=1 Tax=Halococcus qingdaonensis TaxID=224402 RepID=UPI0021161377|nr:universal stress protein [Halococcus qingdaonensis]